MLTMESCSKIALGMLLLTAYLCAQPITPGLIGKLEKSGFEDLTGLKCNAMMFTSPTGVRRECRMQALKHYIDGLKNATGCGDISPEGKLRIDQVKDALSSHFEEVKTNCNFTMTAPKPFQDFVEAAKEFIVLFNNYQSMN